MSDAPLAPVRVALLVVRGSDVLLERCSEPDGSEYHELLVAELEVGRSFADTARDLAARASLGDLPELRFSWLENREARDGRGPAVVVGLVATLAIAPDLEGGDYETPFRFHPATTLPSPLGPEAERAVALLPLSSGPYVTDGGEAVRVAAGSLLATTATPDAIEPNDDAIDASVAHFVRPTSTGALMLLGGMLFGGWLAWAIGVVIAVGSADLIDEDSALLLSAIAVPVTAIVALRKTFARHPSKEIAARIGRAAGGVVAGLATAVLLFVVAHAVGGDDARTAFWFWFFGLLASMGALRIISLRSDAPRAPLTAVRIGAWTACILTSLLAVFPPLRADLARSLSSGPDADRVYDAPEVLFPDDN